MQMPIHIHAVQIAQSPSPSNTCPVIVFHSISWMLEQWALLTASCNNTLTPVKAVPAKNQANGRRYQGAMDIKYKLAEKDAMDVNTAPHALTGFNSNT